MALQSTASASNPLCLSEIKTEFSGISGDCLTDFYGAASGVPSSGNICISDFLGKSSIFQATALSFDSSAAMTAVATGLYPEVYVTGWQAGGGSTTLPSQSAINLATELTNQGWDGTTPVNATVTVNAINTAHTSSDFHNGIWTWKFDGSFMAATLYGAWMTSADFNSNDSVATAYGQSGNQGTRYDIPKDKAIGLIRTNFISGAIPSGSTITINVNGFLQGTPGGGGTLGAIGTTTATAGTDGGKGGPIFDLSAADYDVTWNFTQGSSAKLFRGLGGGGGACGFTWPSYPSFFHQNNSYTAQGASNIRIYNVTKNRFSEMRNLAPLHYEDYYNGSYGTGLGPTPAGYYRRGATANPRYSGIGGAYVQYSSFASNNYGSASTTTGTDYIKCSPTDGQDGYSGDYVSTNNMAFPVSGGDGGADGNIFKYKNSSGATIESDTPPYNWSGTVTVTA